MKENNDKLLDVINNDVARDKLTYTLEDLAPYPIKDPYDNSNDQNIIIKSDKSEMSSTAFKKSPVKIDFW